MASLFKFYLVSASLLLWGCGNEATFKSFFSKELAGGGSEEVANDSLIVDDSLIGEPPQVQEPLVMEGDNLLVTSEGAVSSQYCAAATDAADEQTFPAKEDCSNKNCVHILFSQLIERIKSCLGHDLPAPEGGTALLRSSRATWYSGRVSRYRTSKQSHGDMETHSLELICRIFGYQTYVKSSARDRGDRRGQGRLNWTSPSDNSSLRFKETVTFKDMISDEALTGADFEKQFTTRKNRKNGDMNARYQTWLQTITCKGKIDLISEVSPTEPEKSSKDESQ